MRGALRHLFAFTLASLTSSPAGAADLVTLSPQTWDTYAPDGKEADAIYGDFVLANDQIIVVIGNPKRGRNANMTVREVGGAIIDLTSRSNPNDQLSAFFPGAQLRQLRFAGIEVDGPETYDASDLERVFVRGKKVTLRLVATSAAQQPDATVAYTLEDGWPYVQVTTTFRNPGGAHVETELVDSLRADGPFDAAPVENTSWFWVDDKPWRQSYGVATPSHAIVNAPGRARLLRYRDSNGKVTLTLAPGEESQLVRQVFPGANLFELLAVRAKLQAESVNRFALRIIDEAGNAVPEAEVELSQNGKAVASGKPDDDGRIQVTAAKGPSRLNISARGHSPKSIELPESAEQDRPSEQVVTLSAPSLVSMTVLDADWEPIPAKVQFQGRDGTPSPNLGPDSGEHGVRNVYYSVGRSFQVKLDPGKYDVVVSYGPEYDAAFETLSIEPGKQASLLANLKRSVHTTGWISADFHSHSSPSGDNTSSQFGRVLNLLCEHIEFAPCTEHNRLSSYEPHLKRLNATDRMGTCVGIELTGSPLPLNHQNAFPLRLQPHTQDGGGPQPDLDPETQIERLALWDNGSEKLVQVNHPDIGWMFFDRNGDSALDAGFSGMAGRMDVIEVHPPHFIFNPQTHVSASKRYNNTIYNWLQLLNQGKRIPGVVNTDAHYNFHGSGWLRNYIKSPTDNPAEVKTIDVVHAAEQGHVVMSNGPFLAVSLSTDDAAAIAIPGDSIAAPNGQAKLQVRVQCPNWFDVDRVQVFVNGLPLPDLNFTRETHSAFFNSGTIKFDQQLPLSLKSDAHVIVAAIGEKSKLGAVMGPDHEDDAPVAVSNPIYVDVDGGGFKPNADTMGTLPVKEGR